MREDDIIKVNDNKGIELSGPISTLDIHRYLQDKAARPNNFVSSMLGISSPNPSQSITAKIQRFLNGWYIEPDSIKWINDGAWQDKNGIYNSLVLLGSDPYKQYTVQSDGEVFKGRRDPNATVGPFFIKEGTYFKVLGKPSYSQKIENITIPYNYVAPAPFGESLTQILHKL